MPDDKSCCICKQIFLQSLVLWGLLLLGHMAVLGSKLDTVCFRAFTVDQRPGILVACVFDSGLRSRSETSRRYCDVVEQEASLRL